jgi:hypothetical protein
MLIDRYACDADRLGSSAEWESTLLRGLSCWRCCFGRASFRQARPSFLHFVEVDLGECPIEFESPAKSSMNGGNNVDTQIWDVVFVRRGDRLRIRIHGIDLRYSVWVAARCIPAHHGWASANGALAGQEHSALKERNAFQIEASVAVSARC